LTKVILPLHLFGKCADMASIMSIADRHNLYVIEDAAQASGASMKMGDTYAQAGTVGTIGCFSHFPTKNLGCYGDGGSICTNNATLATRIRRIKKHGQISKYIHKIVGINSRLDAIQAAILNVKLKYLDRYNQYRKTIARIYATSIDHKGIAPQPYKEDHTYHQYALTVHPELRDELKNKLSNLGISSTTYYPLSITEQEAMKGKIRIHSDRKSKSLALSNLCLPISNTITRAEVDYIVQAINYKI